MFRYLRTQARLRAPVVPRPRPHPHRQFWARPQHNFNYAPELRQTYRPRKSWGSRLFDMAIGSGLTVGAYYIYNYYKFRKFAREIAVKIAEHELRAAKRQKFNETIAELAETGDNELLRETIFEYYREVTSRDSPVSEVGPLPGFPEGDELYGKETVAPEDTLMFIERDQSERARICILCLIVNAPADEFGMVLPGHFYPADPEKGKLGEIFRRIDHQAAEWRLQGELRDEDDFVIVLTIRARTALFLYNSGRFQSITMFNDDLVIKRGEYKEDQ
ncbi:hypothetical protein F4779DRAFT_142096 [Xylariaceae sp. FL0662B]|nr:hypothetical protein F4779DRAFT_142096 [Xylariaceae sp. FL0662B]